MRSSVAQSVARVGNTTPAGCRHSIGYLLYRTTQHQAFAHVAAHPTDVTPVNHTQSISLVCPHRALYPPPLMQRAMPCGDTMMPFCEGEYLPRAMGRMLLFIHYDYSCCLIFRSCRRCIKNIKCAFFEIIGFDNARYIFTLGVLRFYYHHSSIAIKNTSLQSVRAISEMA